MSHKTAEVKIAQLRSQIQDVEVEISLTKKNKSTEFHVGLLRKRIARLKTQAAKYQVMLDRQARSNLNRHLIREEPVSTTPFVTDSALSMFEDTPDYILFSKDHTSARSSEEGATLVLAHPGISSDIHQWTVDVQSGDDPEDKPVVGVIAVDKAGLEDPDDLPGDLPGSLGLCSDGALGEGGAWEEAGGIPWQGAVVIEVDLEHLTMLWRAGGEEVNRELRPGVYRLSVYLPPRCEVKIRHQPLKL
eukprot:gnl/Dysnectes_brevis/4236_a5605_495.p1 GENE.gnl/Dysnectes_brevis/4236_a5605_495~~gnl/Dysnectes_brevis/4236_a5605_495.p1  ORF type:complete len:246 (-),score=46.04 gnl/Dysnectes_brevis/4236_a5605_495:40-777(-)